MINLPAPADIPLDEAFHLLGLCLGLRRWSRWSLRRLTFEPESLAPIPGLSESAFPHSDFAKSRFVFGVGVNKTDHVFGRDKGVMVNGPKVIGVRS